MTDEEPTSPKLNRLLRIREIDALRDLVPPIFPIDAKIAACPHPDLVQAVEAVCGPAPWIVRSAGMEDLADHVNAGGYDSLICQQPEDLLQCITAVAFSGSTEHAQRQQALSGSGRGAHSTSKAIACFVQPLLDIDVVADVGPTHSPYVDPEVLSRMEAVCATLMDTFDFSAIDCEWGLETTLGFVSVTTIMPHNLQQMHIAHTMGFGFASAQSTGARATTLALRPAGTTLRLWRGHYVRETQVQRLHLLQARPAQRDAAFRQRVVLTDACYEALSQHYDRVEAGLLMLGTYAFGHTLVAPDLMSAWHQYLGLTSQEQAAVAVVMVDEGSAEEHAGIMFRQQKITCVRMNTQRVPTGANYVVFDRGMCILGDAAMLRVLETEVCSEMVLPDDCALVFTEACRDAFSQLQQLHTLPLDKTVKERLLARTEQPMATWWMQRYDGAVQSPSLLAQMGRSHPPLRARTEFAKAYERAVKVSQTSNNADVQLVMALLDCDAAASWVPAETLERLCNTARGGRDDAVFILNTVALVREACAQLPVYETDEAAAILDALARAFEKGLSTQSMASLHALGLPIASRAMLAAAVLDHPNVLEPITACRQATAQRSPQLNEAWWRLREALCEADLSSIAEQIRGSLIETYDALLKGLLVRAMEGEETYLQYLAVMQQWIAFLRQGRNALDPCHIVLEQFEAWLRQWHDEPMPSSFEIADRHWPLEFNAIAASGETAPRYDNPHVVHNLLHQWSLSGLHLETQQLPQRIQALAHFCATFSSRATKVLRFERALLEIQIPMGTHKASYVFTPQSITVEWTEPPDCPSDEIARLLAFEVFLARYRTWMFPTLTVRRAQVLGTWTLFIRLGTPTHAPTYQELKRFVVATRFLFDASYDFSYIENDAVACFAERFHGPDWASVLTTLLDYRAVIEDTSQYVALHTLPMSSTVGAITQHSTVRGLFLRCLRHGFDGCCRLIDRYAHWLDQCTEDHHQWPDRYELLRQASLFLAAKWPREALARLTQQTRFHVGHDLIAACLFKRSDMKEALQDWTLDKRSDEEPLPFSYTVEKKTEKQWSW